MSNFFIKTTVVDKSIVRRIVDKSLKATFKAGIFLIIKEFADAGVVTESLSLTFAKPRSDSFGATDAHAFSFAKVTSNASNATESNTLSFGKGSSADVCNC